MSIFKRMTPIQRLMGLLVFSLAAIALFAGIQFYLGHIEATEAADRCYDKGGWPVIEKSGWDMTYFECKL